MLCFQVAEDASNPVVLVAAQSTLLAVPSPSKKKSAIERRAEAAKLKGTSVKARDFVHPALFQYFQYLIPEMQILVLERMKMFYHTKQHIMADVNLLFPMSVSVSY